MPRSAILVPILVVLLAGVAGAASAADPQPANEQVVVPQVDRRDIKVPRIRSNDIEFGGFLGTYNAENFGSSSVRGLRLGYHVTEDLFVEGTYGRTTVSDQAFRQILPTGIFPQPKEKLTYYDAAVGYNLFPGEVFFGRNKALVSSVYLIAGIGSTHFINSQLVNESHQTVTGGIGMRLLMADWVALQVDIRDHVFANDILGQRKTTQNFELTGGLTFFF